MENETNPTVKAENWEKYCGKPYKHWHKGGCGGFYFLTFIGAAVYYVQHSETFWMGVLGVLKALVWPALLMYELLKLLKM